MESLLNNLKSLLQKDERLVSEGEILKNKVIELALKLDKELIKLLLSDEKMKEVFFVDVESTLIFDKDKFIKFVSNKQFLPDSYTAFKNKIGLIDEKGEFISEKRDVVLSWPYKDCVLEGGMAKEEQKRDEIFWNEILAPDEISRLLDPKVFTNAKRIDKEGEHKFDGFKTDENGNIKDNLIIKGNNLLVLHSLKKRFAGKVKLIYIDPPYNRGTETDDFLYNDRFKHSSWLTFIKNRLEIAWDILMYREGFIWISISDEEAHYLKTICDEIFNRENFVADVIWNSTKSVTNTAVISEAHTHNLLYVKDISWLKKNRIAFRLPADASKFSNPDNDPRGPWVADPFQVGGVRPNQQYPIKNPKTGKIYYPLSGNSWKNEEKVFQKLLADNRIVFGVGGEAGPQRKRFWSEAEERGEVTTTLWHDLPTTTDATKHLKEMFGEKIFHGAKPEELIQRIIQLSTCENDIILDFFAGSGTTAAVALKMNRQFIICEQMDYVESVTVERIKKVIAGEQGGISKSVGWKGGGDFVYLELMKWNQNFVEKIQKAETKDDLKNLWKTIKENKEAFLSYKVDIKTIDEHAKDFEDLSIENQKRFLLECLDKNHLYVNYSEIDDEEYGVSEEDKKLNREFYGK